MPERQSTPGGTTAEQDAEAPPRSSTADAASSPDEPTRPVSRGDAAASAGDGQAQAHPATPPSGSDLFTPASGPSTPPADDGPGEPDDEPDTASDVTRPAESPIVVVRTPDAERTQVIRIPEAATVKLAAHPEAPTVAQPIGTAAAQADAPTVAQPPPDDPDTDGTPTKPRRRRRRLLLVGGGVVAALALLYGGDLALSAGTVPRGVTVAG